MTSTELAREPLQQRIKRKIKQTLGPWGIFVEGFIRNPVMVGSIVPSSRYTIRRMLAKVDWENTKLFVEYGPGVGTFCQPVLDRLPRDGMLLVIDTNPLFIDYLKSTIRDSRFHPVLGSAEDVEAIVQALGYEKADYVLSGLPFSTLPEGVGEGIAAATHRVVRRGGAFLTYQFRGSARDLTARFFKRIETGFAWWNIPPCLLCWGWQED